MQWSRVKTILIAILLLVDSFLIAMLGGKALFAYQRRQEMREHVQTVLEKSEITLADSMKIPGSALMPQLSIDRSRSDEAALANALLGGMAERRAEGEESHFESAHGEVIWNEQGEISARLTPADYKMPEAAQIRVRAAEILQAAGLHMPDLVWQVEGNAAAASVRIAGYEVFNRSLTIEFTKRDVCITGRWTFDLPYATKSDFYADYNPADALMIFAQYGPASQIESMEPGLLLTNTAGNHFQVGPVWRIVTSRGTFFVDPLKKTMV